MDPRFAVSRDELYDVQMDLKRVHVTQQQHSDRLRVLEKRQADDAALKSVWNSPFPSALGGTPQHGPLHMPSTEQFSDFDEQGQMLLGALQLEAEDEPIRRGAASRANSVRFDESALHGANWGAQSGRQSGDFGPIRPSSGMGGHQLMERSLSHKSDGRHSSAGHSVHSVHSAVSGRASSLGLDTNFLIGGNEDNSPLDIPEPPPMFYVLGSAPSIIRCWLTTEWTSGGLLYAVVCTGSQRSTVEYSLLRDLDLVAGIHKDSDGTQKIELCVFLAEATVTQSNSRSASPNRSLPSISAIFEVTGTEQPETADARKSIRVFIGSHTLRLHSADLLLSQNSMTLYGNDRDKLSVPFVRPEDDAAFKYLITTSIVPGKLRLNATAPEFVSSEKGGKGSTRDTAGSVHSEPKSSESSSEDVLSPTTERPRQPVKATAISSTSESGGESEMQPSEPAAPENFGRESSGLVNGVRRGPSTAIKTPWRQTAAGLSGDISIRGENTLLSGYQPPATRPRSMKVLRPTKSANPSSFAKIGAAYEPAPTQRNSSESRHKGQVEGGGQPNNGSAGSWSAPRRSLSTSTSAMLGNAGSGGDSTKPSPAKLPEVGTPTSVLRTASNPLGSASAFSWIKPKTPTAAAE
ncbi:hypothetical protein B0T26DRAFT_641803 [Lasiosphaeria miniovina]|uniref:Ubiquitin carboxyl-terminal hydrolase 19 n=1 Tax=Lasiosphaeria miniovina TaxID=1954250 RepID=A0AA40AUQ4_9PEZI|nr:uncharacterized protein B0T26DRAFT_641803 [Lasiosphaeria miniovina]KAK0722372.1 hypothetical protein B0T26DRAFT_641803 [Lasiosphaeria miniovina]